MVSQKDVCAKHKKLRKHADACLEGANIIAQREKGIFA